MLPLIAADPAVAAVLPYLALPGEGTVVCPPGLRPPLVALAPQDRPIVIVTATGREAEQFSVALAAWGVDSTVFPAWETLPHERLSPQVDTMARRIAVLRRLAHPEDGDPQAGPIRVLVVPVRALLQPVISGLGQIEPRRIRVGDYIDRDQTVADLVALGYEPTDLVESRGQVSVHGGIIDVFPPTSPHPLRLELFGDEVEEVRFFHLEDQRSLRESVTSV